MKYSNEFPSNKATVDKDLEKSISSCRPQSEEQRKASPPRRNRTTGIVRPNEKKCLTNVRTTTSDELHHPHSQTVNTGHTMSTTLLSHSGVKCSSG